MTVSDAQRSADLSQRLARADRRRAHNRYQQARRRVLDGTGILADNLPDLRVLFDDELPRLRSELLSGVTAYRAARRAGLRPDQVDDNVWLQTLHFFSFNPAEEPDSDTYERIQRFYVTLADHSLPDERRLDAAFGRYLIRGFPDEERLYLWNSGRIHEAAATIVDPDCWPRAIPLDWDLIGNEIRRRYHGQEPPIEHDGKLARWWPPGITYANVADLIDSGAVVMDSEPLLDNMSGGPGPYGNQKPARTGQKQTREAEHVTDLQTVSTRPADHDQAAA